MFLVAKVKKRRETMRGGKYDVATVPAVPSIRAAARDEHLTPETADAVAASACFDHYADFVNEHGIYPA